MALIKSSDVIRNYVYKLIKMSIVVNGKRVEDIPNERLTYININEDYEGMYFPLFSITLSMSKTLYAKFIEYKNDMKFYIRIDKCYKYKSSGDELSYSANKAFINQNFDLIWDEDTEDGSLSTSKARNRNDFTTLLPDFESMMEQQNQSVTLYLFSSGQLAGLKKTVNKVLSKCTVTDAIGYLATVAGINNILMAPSDFTTKRDEIIIPPMSCMSAFGFLDYKYGIYKKGSVIFFGVKYTYIMPYTGKCKCWDKTGSKNTIIIVPSSTSSNGNMLGVLIRSNKDKTDYIVADYKSVDKRNESISNDYIYANDLQVVDSYDEDVTTELSGANAKGTNFSKVFENKTENKDLGKAYTAQTKALSVVIQLNSQDIDVDALTPNKKFNVLFEDSEYTSKYNGEYILTNANYLFSRSGNEFVIDTTLTLKKTD